MKKHLSLFLALFLVISLAACGGSGSSTAESSSGEESVDAASEDAGGSSLRIAMVQGPRGDNGFNDQAYKGLEMARDDFGITFDTYESNDLTEIDAALRNYADSEEYDLIIGVGSTHADPISMVASDYPDQIFSLVDTMLETPLDNVHSNAAIDAEQGFLSGVISGFVTMGEYSDAFEMANSDKNVIVYAGGKDNPTSRAGAAGFMAGVYYVNPDCEILYTIVDSYNDPVKAKEIAMNGIARGADIITGNCGSSSLGLNEAAKEGNCYYIATSPAGLDPNYSLCTSVKLTENQIYDEIKAVVEGAWASGGERQGIAAGYCDYSIEGVSVEYPQELLDQVNAIREEVQAGRLALPSDVDQLDEWKAANQFAG